MNLFVLITLIIAGLATQTFGLYEDQIGKFDWVQRGLGSIHLAEFEDSVTAEGGPARRLAVATTHNVLALLNTKNGEIVWRQVMEAGPMGAIDSLHVGSGEVSVVTGNPPLLRTFDVHTAALIQELPLQLPFKMENMYGRRLVLQHESSVTVAHLTEGSAEVTSFSSSTGLPLLPPTLSSQPWISSSSQCALTASSLVCVEESLGLLLSLPLIQTDTTEPGFKSTSLQSLGLSVSVEAATSSDCPLLAPSVTLDTVHGSRLHLVIRAGASGVLLSTEGGLVSAVQEAGNLPRALSVTSDGVLYRVVQDRQAVRISGFDLSTGAELVSRSLACELPVGEGEAVAGVRRLTVQQYSRRGDGEMAVRALLVLDDDSVHLLAAPGVAWSREEALASVLAVEAVDLPVPASSVSMHDHISQRAGLLGSLMHRVQMQSSSFLAWLGEVLEGSLSGSGATPDSQPVLNRDDFNLHKLLIVATKPGKVFALDNWSGAVVWSAYLPSVRALPSDKLLLYLQRSVAHFPHPAQMALLAMQKESCDGAVYTFNPLTGEPMAGGLQLLPYRISQASLLQQNDNLFIKPVLVVDTSLGVHVFPASCEESVVLQHKDMHYVTTRNTSHLTGYSLRTAKPGALTLTPVWSSFFPPGVISGVYPKRANDRVHSSGRVMADRSVLYKYTNPNLAVVVAHGDQPLNKNSISVYLVDLVSGAVVDWISHQRVSGPVHVIHSENWVVYTYHNDKQRRTEVHSLELFEGPTQANASAFSSLAGLPQPPIVERQAYILPHGVQAVAHTTTEKSITTKYLLLALDNGGVTQVARWLVDPRRPLSAGGPREEGLMPYAPEVPLPPTEVISYNQSLPRVTGIFSAPTGLESTCIVFVYGLDLFFSRVFPSKMFDMLKDDFDYFLIVGVLLSLVVAAVVTRRLAQRKALYHLWK